MFGIGMPEMLLLLAVALIVFGPKKLPELAKSLGRAMGEFKRATSDLKDSIESETGIGNVRDNFNDVAKEINTPAKAAGDLPDPEPKDEHDATRETDTDADAAEGAAPLKDVKAAFDELNSDKDESAEISKTGDSGTTEEPDTKSQDETH